MHPSILPPGCLDAFADPVGAEAFWIEANRFLDAYIDAEFQAYVGIRLNDRV